MRVGERAKVIKLDRPTEEDRTAREGAEGLLVRRLNVPWTPDLGALWEVRFEDGNVVVFSEDELAVIAADGREHRNDMAGLAESWGDAPRRPSLPFKRFGAGVATAPAVLALLVFALAGVLLVWAGLNERSVVLGGAGVGLMLVGIAAAGVLIS